MLKLGSAPNRQRIQSTRAQALVEIALLLPMLLFLTLGALDFGRLFYTKIMLTNAAREGVNYLSRHPEDLSNGYYNTYLAIDEELNNSILNMITLTKQVPENCCTAGQYVGVTVTANNIDLFLAPLYRIFFSVDDPIDISSTAKMVVQ